MAGVSGIGKIGNEYNNAMSEGEKGTIDGKEVDRMAEAMGMDKQEFLKKYDKDGDGKISGKELNKLLQDLMKSGMEKTEGMDGDESPQAGPAGKTQGSEKPGGKGGEQKQQAGPAEKTQGSEKKEDNQDFKSMDFKEAAGADNQLDKEEATKIGMDANTFDKFAGTDGQMNQQEFNQAQTGAAPAGGAGV